MRMRDSLSGVGEYIAPDHTRLLAQLLDTEELSLLDDKSFQRTLLVKRALARPLEE